MSVWRGHEYGAAGRVRPGQEPSSPGAVRGRTAVLTEASSQVTRAVAPLNALISATLRK